MIHNLISAIVALLQEQLGGVKVQASLFTSTPSGSDLPAVGVYPGKFAIQQTAREVLPTPHEEGSKQTLTLQCEFQQELLLDAYGADAGEAEKWASLVCNVVLSSTEEILHSINTDNPGYRSGSFNSVHLPKQLKLMEGTLSLADNVWSYRLKFSVLGELRLIRLFPESPAVISEVVIEQKLG